MSKPTKGEIRRLTKRIKDDILALHDAIREDNGRNALLFMCDLQRAAKNARALIEDRYPEANPVEEDDETDEADDFEDDELEEGEEGEEGEEDEEFEEDD